MCYCGQSSGLITEPDPALRSLFETKRAFSQLQSPRSHSQQLLMKHHSPSCIGDLGSPPTTTALANSLSETPTGLASRTCSLRQTGRMLSLLDQGGHPGIIPHSIKLSNVRKLARSRGKLPGQRLAATDAIPH